MKFKPPKSLAKFTKTDWLAFGLLLLFSFLLFYKLGTKIFNNDAHFWYARTYNFVAAIKKGDLAGTYQNPKPGVTVMALSGLSIEAFLSIYNMVFGFRPHLYTFDTFPYIHFMARAPLVLLMLGLAVLFYLTIKKFENEKFALVTLFIMTIQPFLLAGTRIFHGDSTLMIFMVASALFLWLFLNGSNKTLLVISGIMGGLALNTKLSAIFLLPYVLLLLILNKASLKYYLIWLFSMALTVFVTFPALWVSPFITLQNLFLEGTVLTTAGRDGINPFTYYLEVIPSLFSFTFLFLTFVGFFRIVRHKGKQEYKIGLYSALFIIFYILQMSLVSQKMPRYLLPTVPFFAILATYGLNFFEKIKYLLLLLMVAPLLVSFPNYSLAFNARDSFDCTLCDEVANVINSSERGVEFNVLVDARNPQRFRPFIKGTVIKEDEYVLGDSIDYVITEFDEKQNYTKNGLNCIKLDDVTFRNVNYWSIFECRFR